MRTSALQRHRLVGRILAPLADNPPLLKCETPVLCLDSCDVDHDVLSGRGWGLRTLFPKPCSNQLSFNSLAYRLLHRGGTLFRMSATETHQ